MGRYLPSVKARVSPDTPFGVGLRLSARAAAELANPEALAELKAFLEREDLYVFTINGFPYGDFSDTRVKENVYLPDWRDERRVVYTNTLADILAELLPAHAATGSVSTVPCALRTNVTGDAAARITDALLRHAAHLVGVRAKTGRTIVLAIEPEPECYLETVLETVAFFQERLTSDAAVRRLAELTGLDAAAAGAALQRHLGVCLDLCHAAVEFENPAQALALLSAAGIRIAKMQISAGLRVREMSAAGAAALQPFDDGVYLHQVVARNGHGLQRYLDLDVAFAALHAEAKPEWRIHFHVPIFLANLGAFETTQPFLVDVLALHREHAISPHLEIETYTWGVLPAEHRSDDIAASISREIEWVLWQLAA
jgi:sugar phosphate isomerase/epimerase